MDELEVNGNAEGVNFDGDNDDLFAVPPPLGSLLADDPANIGEQNGAFNLQDNVADDDTAQDSEEKKKKKRAFAPRVILNEERLCSKKGIEALKNLCTDVTFKGKGHEVSDLNKLLHRFEHWAQCLMPRWPFDNVVQKCEVLGKKSKVRNELKRVRSNEDEVLRGETEDEEDTAVDTGETVTNEEHSTEDTTEVEQEAAQEETPAPQLTEEQVERMRRNRELAFERREANKRRRLAEESQTQSQLEDLPADELPTILENSSEQSSFTNVSEIPRAEEICEVNAIKDIPQDFPTNDEASLNSGPENDGDIENTNNIPERNSPELSNMVSHTEEHNDHSSDSEDDILSRSAFEPNTTTNNELSLNTTREEAEVVDTVNEVEDRTPMSENARLEPDSPRHTSSSSLITTTHANLSTETCIPSPETTEEASAEAEEMQIDSATTE